MGLFELDVKASWDITPSPDNYFETVRDMQPKTRTATHIDSYDNITPSMLRTDDTTVTVKIVWRPSILMRETDLFGAGASLIARPLVKNCPLLEKLCA